MDGWVDGWIDTVHYNYAYDDDDDLGASVSVKNGVE